MTHTRGLFVCRWGAGFKQDRCKDVDGGLFFFSLYLAWRRDGVGVKLLLLIVN